MGMFRAIGFVIILVAIRLIIPDIFHAGEEALLSMFDFVTHAMGFAGDALDHSTSVLNSMNKNSL